MTEEFKSVLTLVVSGFKKSAKEAQEAVKSVKSEIDGASEKDAFAKVSKGVKDVGKAAVSANAGLSSLRNGMNSTSMAAKSLMATLGKVISVATIVAGIKAAISEGSSAAAEEAQFTQVFGNLEDAAKQALQSIADESGFTAYSMRSSFSAIASFAKTTGMDTAEALSLTERAMAAATDSAAFYDRELDDVVENMRSFLKGNYENDAALGLSSTETTRNAMAMRLYGQEFAKLTETQKEWTLLAQIEEANQLSGALGQAARESNNWAVNVQRLKSQFQNLLSVIGRGFIAILTPVVTVLNIILSALVDFANAVSDVFSDLFGSDNTNLTPSLATVDASGLEDYSNAISDAASGAGDLADAESGAATAAKELNRQVMGFDQINKLPSVSASSSGSSGSSGGSGSGGSSGLGVTGATAAAAGSMLDSVTEKTNAFSEGMQKFRDFLAGLDFTPLATAWDHLKESAGRLGDVLMGGLRWGLENVLEPLAEWTIEEAEPRAVEALALAFEDLALFLEDVQPLWQWAWDNILKSLAKSTADSYIRGLDGLIELLGTVKGYLQDINDVLNGEKSFGEMLSDWLDPDKQLSEMADLWQVEWEEPEWMSAIESFIDKLGSGSQSLLNFFDPANLDSKIEVGVGLVQDGWSTAWDWVKERWGTAKSAAVALSKSGWTTVKDWVAERIGGAVSSLIALSKSGWTTVKDWISSRLGGAVSKAVGLTGSGWSKVSDWVKTKLGTAVLFAIGLKQGWTGTVASWIKSKFGSFSKSIGLTISWKTSGLSTLQKAVSKALFGSAKWPTLKFAARGGIVNAATLFNDTVIGESGKEAILPLERNTEWMDKWADKAAEKVAQRLSASGGSGQPVIVKLYLDGRQITQTVVDTVNEQAVRTGYNPLSAYL